MNTTNLKLAVIIGSTRPERFGDKPAKWIFDELKTQPGVVAELLDLRDYPMPFYDESGSVAALDGKYSSEVGLKWAHKINEFDGYVIVTPEYNHGYSAVLKNALDYAYTEWNKKPVAFVAYGGVAGARAVEQLRQVVAELQMVSLRQAVHIPDFWTRTNADGTFKSDGLDGKKDEMFENLLWWAKALKVAREVEKAQIALGVSGVAVAV